MSLLCDERCFGHKNQYVWHGSAAAGKQLFPIIGPERDYQFRLANTTANKVNAAPVNKVHISQVNMCVRSTEYFPSYPTVLLLAWKSCAII